MIIPKQFLKTIKRTGLGKSLFYEMRYDENGKIVDNFILNNIFFYLVSIYITLPTDLSINIVHNRRPGVFT